MAVRITHIDKDDRYDAHERIQAIGGINPNLTTWKRSQTTAIEDIERGRYSYYVTDGSGRAVDVIVAVSRFGNKYIKTVADGESPNNLLSLPEVTW